MTATPYLKNRPALSGAARASLAFTLVELLVVITIIGVIASMLFTIGPGAYDKRNEARVKAEMRKLETAIIDYKNFYGSYPPDNTNAIALNPLFYELGGATLRSNANGTWTFQSLVDNSYIDAAVYSNIFFNGGVMNVTYSSVQAKAKQVLSMKGSDWADFLDAGGNTYKVLIVPAKGTSNSITVNNGKPYNLWRYVSSNPTNRPGEFDLWAEILKGNKQTKIIGNWQR